MYWFARYWWLALLVLMFLWNFWGTVVLLFLVWTAIRMVLFLGERVRRATLPPEVPAENVVEWR